MREFESLGQLAEHFTATAVTIVVAEQNALKKCAKLIDKTAKEEIGEYQPAVGPFPSWAPLAASTEAEKARLGYPADAPLLREGDLRDSIKHEVEGLEAVVGSESEIAAYQEFGTDKIPPRPFMGPAAFRNKQKIKRILGEGVVEGLAGGSAIRSALGYDMDVTT